MFINPLLLTDSYKVSHWKQYPPGTSKVYSYLESRGGNFKETVFFGLQILLKEFLQEQILHRDVKMAHDFYAAHFGSDKVFNVDGFNRIINKHDGFWPVSIKAVPEGTVVPTHNILVSVENTDPELPWVTNYIETLLVQLWYPITVATLSREIKKIIQNYLVKTGDPNLLPFKLHDFGFRGVSSVDSAGIGGAAHLVNFMGSDTLAGIVYAKEYYGAEMPGYSIPAAEHSTITSWGKENEVEAFRNMIKQFGTGMSGLYAVVSDSYNIFDACEKLWGEQLRAEVLAAPNTLVIRPDSGNPTIIVSNVLRILGNKFGFTTNDKGFKVLNKVRVIQGDGIDLIEINNILAQMHTDGWSADNVAFGMGGALLQKMNRDTNNFAFKTSQVEVNGESRDVSKSPITSKLKTSKSGRFSLIQDHNYQLQTVIQTPETETKDQLVEVFRNGKLLVEHTFNSVRERAAV